MILLEEDFATETAINTNNWTYLTGAAAYIPSSESGIGTELQPSLPSIQDDALQFTLQTYNPTASTPGNSFYGSDIVSKSQFDDNVGPIVFTAVAKLAPPPETTLPPGLDGAVFAYGYNSSTSHNEIDFESLSENSAAQPNEEQVNSYDDKPVNTVGNPALVPDPNLDAYQTYSIEWSPTQVTWYINGVQVYKIAANIPQGPLNFELDFWAPFNPASTGLLQPATSAAESTTYDFDVQYASVAQIEADTMPPALSGGGVTAIYTGEAAVAIAPALGVSDPSSSTLLGGEVSITAGFLAGDMLNFTNQNGIVGTYNAAIGTLTLTGVASLLDYQAALDSITFSSSAADPTSGGSDNRTIDWTVTDGTLSSQTVASTIDLIGLYGGGGVADFPNGYGDEAYVYNTGGSWASVYGSDGTVHVTNGMVVVIGGDDTIDFSSSRGNGASLYNTDGTWDTVNGSNGAVILTKAYVIVNGGDDGINFQGAANAASLSDTAGTWDSVMGSGGLITLTDADTYVTGGGDAIYFEGASVDAASLFDTGGVWDGVYGSNGTIELTSAYAAVIGGGDAIDFAGADDAASLSETAGVWDAINGSNGEVVLNNAFAEVTGGDDAVYFEGNSGNAAALYNTGGVFDAITGSNGEVVLTAAFAEVTGGGDAVYFEGTSANIVALYNTGGAFDGVTGSNGEVVLTNAQAEVVGGGNSIYLEGAAANTAALYNTGTNADAVTGSNGLLVLTNAQAMVTGASDTIYLVGANNVTQNGASDVFVFQPTIGEDTINGFAATDTMQFSASDFANFAALQSHVLQSGANTVIALDANDTVTLTNVLATSLSASQFHFV